jgi:hypothetical protein
VDITNSNINRDLFKDFYLKKRYAEVPLVQNDKKEEKTGFNLPVAAATIIGTLLPVLIIKKYQGKKLFKIEYGLKEMLFASFGSILGGLSGGILFNKDEDRKTKVKELVFQFVNIAVPTGIIAGILKLTDKSRNFKGAMPKIASVIVGIGGGMPLAAFISNSINNHIIDKDNPCKRKLCLKDCLVHVDDLVGALVLAKIPFVDKLHVDKILPLLYGLCGYEAGTKKAEKPKNCIQQ